MRRMFGRRGEVHVCDDLKYQVASLCEGVIALEDRVSALEEKSDSTDQALRKRVRDLEEEVRYQRRLIKVSVGVGLFLLAGTRKDVLDFLLSFVV